jgi:hypothetical protein
MVGLSRVSNSTLWFHKHRFRIQIRSSKLYFLILVQQACLRCLELFATLGLSLSLLTFSIPPPDDQHAKVAEGKNIRDQLSTKDCQPLSWISGSTSLQIFLRCPGETGIGPEPVLSYSTCFVDIFRIIIQQGYFFSFFLMASLIIYSDNLKNEN